MAHIMKIEFTMAGTRNRLTIAFELSSCDPFNSLKSLIAALFSAIKCIWMTQWTDLKTFLFVFPS